MLDSQRYYAAMPNDESERLPRLLLSEELLVTLAAIEKEISAFIRATADPVQQDETLDAKTGSAE
jgi:hypothetical protein